MNRLKAIPSMFHRRLLLLAGGVLLITGTLAAQLARLAIAEGDERLALAESRLHQRRFLPTYRGQILDRHGRVLALDRSSYDIAVPYEVIAGTWAYDQAQKQARRAAGPTQWHEWGPEQRSEAALALLPDWQAKVEPLWDMIMRIGGFDRAELDPRLDEIRRQVQMAATTIWDRRAAEYRERYGVSEEEASDKTQLKIREQQRAHVILPRVTDEVAFEFQQWEREWPDLVEVVMSARREYPLTTVDVTLDRTRLPRAMRAADASPSQTMTVIGVADHVLGSMRDEVWASDVQRRPFIDPVSKQIDLGGYRPGDTVGARGLELAHEPHLRGARGMVHTRLDTREETRTPMTPGRDLQTTLDASLQARVQAILSPEFGLTSVQQWQAGWSGGEPNPTGLPLGTQLKSAAVVVEVESGEILALASMPSLAMGRELEAAGHDGGDSLVNRAVDAIYPPGSIIKPLVLSAAVMERVHSIDGSITCNGHFFPERNNIARCWIYRDRYQFRTHGALQAEDAIAQSCNIFFYTLADRLGMKRLSSWYQRFGLGQPLDVGLLCEVERPVLDGAGQPVVDENGKPRTKRQRIGEAAGEVPDEARIAELRARGELAFASVILGTGQGPVAWTPVQAANAYATLARGGVVRDATLIRDPSRERLVPQRENIALDSRLVTTALEGLRQSVEERSGTGHHLTYADGSIEPIINAPGVTVWAKTGTAQASPMQLDDDADGSVDRTISDLSHAWFVGLVGEKGAKRPQYVIAVIVEYGGSGGKAAGPVANQIILALQAEGYLGGEHGLKLLPSPAAGEDES